MSSSLKQQTTELATERDPFTGNSAEVDLCLFAQGSPNINKEGIISIPCEDIPLLVLAIEEN